MGGYLKLFLLITLFVQVLSCKNDKDIPRNPYENDSLQILDETRTLTRINEIEVVKNEFGEDDIIVHSFNGAEASFYSNKPCEGPGPSYNVIGSIPSLGIVFLDRVYSCHRGETTIMVSLKDGIYRELKTSVWNIDQFSISPNGSWLVISSYDCSLSNTCTIEILDLKNSPNSLLATKFFNSRVCTNNNLNWFSDNGFMSQTVIGEDFGDCIYSPIQFEYINNEWSFNIK